MADSFGPLRVALQRHGYQIDTSEFRGSPVLVGRTSAFRWRWMASRLHTFVVVADFSSEVIERSELDRFLSVACGYAKSKKGGLPRGLQTGTATVAVALVRGDASTAEQWASNNHGTAFATIAYPVVANLDSGVVTHPGRMIVGALFNSHLRSVADDLIGDAVRSQ